MKRIVSFLLAFLYFASTTGATKHLHYCMGKLIETNIGTSESKTCGNCGMDKKDAIHKGCCKDEYKKVKVEKEHKVVQGTVLEF